jgi:hypothetical protein
MELIFIRTYAPAKFARPDKGARRGRNQFGFGGHRRPFSVFHGSAQENSVFPPTTRGIVANSTKNHD